MSGFRQRKSIIPPADGAENEHSEPSVKASSSTSHKKSRRRRKGGSSHHNADGSTTQPHRTNNFRRRRQQHKQRSHSNHDHHGNSDHRSHHSRHGHNGHHSSTTHHAEEKDDHGRRVGKLDIVNPDNGDDSISLSNSNNNRSTSSTSSNGHNSRRQLANRKAARNKKFKGTLTLLRHSTSDEGKSTHRRRRSASTDRGAPRTPKTPKIHSPRTPSGRRRSKFSSPSSTPKDRSSGRPARNFLPQSSSPPSSSRHAPKPSTGLPAENLQLTGKSPEKPQTGLSSELFEKLSKRVNLDPTSATVTKSPSTSPGNKRHALGHYRSSSSTTSNGDDTQSVLGQSRGSSTDRLQLERREQQLRAKLEKRAQELFSSGIIPDINVNARRRSGSVDRLQASGPAGTDPLTGRGPAQPASFGILGVRKKLEQPRKITRRYVGPTPRGARNRQQQQTPAHDEDGEEEPAAPQVFERPAQRRLRLREKIVAVLDRINEANVPIVAAGACRYDLGDPGRIISDKQDRCTIQVGHLSVGTEEGNNYNVEVVIKNQLVSSDSDDFEEVLEDFCIECVTGWSVSKFKDYWEASFHNFNDDSDFEAEESDEDSVSADSGDNIFLSLAHGREITDEDGIFGFGGPGKAGKRAMSPAATTNTALAQYLMGCNSQTLLTLIQHARRWTNSLVPAATKTRVNTTFAAAVERVRTSEMDDDYDPQVHKYNLLIVMQFSRPAFPLSYGEESTRLSMDLTDWIQADSFWKCIREADVDTGERAISRISFLDDDGNTFIYNMDEVMKNHLCLELARALVELWRTGYLHCDIKPANFIVCADDDAIKSPKRRSRRFASNARNIKLKLIDFGEGGRKSEIQGIIAGTDWYMAPEMRDYGTPSIQSEVYSTGVSMIEIWYGELWDGTRSAEACLADAITNISARNSIVGQFLHRCLAKDPDNRPYPYDLYTFFSNQCNADSSIFIGEDDGFASGERKTLEDQELRLQELEAQQQRRREQLENKKLERRRAEQRRRDKYRRQRHSALPEAM